MNRRILVGLLLAGWLAPATAAELAVTYIGASDAVLGNPHDLKLSPDGKTLWVADVDHDRRIRLRPTVGNPRRRFRRCRPCLRRRHPQ